MADYQAVPANESSDVHNPTLIKRKPVSVAYQPPPASNASWDNAKDSQVLLTPSSTDNKPNDGSSPLSDVGRHRDRLSIWRLW